MADKLLHVFTMDLRYILHSVQLKTHILKWRFFLWIWAEILIYFAQWIFIHNMLLINAYFDWFKVIRFALHISRQKTLLVRGHNMIEEIEQF